MMLRNNKLTFALLVGVAIIVANAAPASESNGESGHVVKDKPIIVQTPLQNYDQPTVSEYEECQRNRNECTRVCDVDQKCLDECPLCPELYDQPVLVQGINDTGYAGPPAIPVNTTNVIRLTNEINNFINNDIRMRHENNVKVVQNISQVGGRFGLGYNEEGSCCFVVHRPRECEQQPKNSQSAGSCRITHQRVCGQRCQARVMHARVIVQCDAAEPENCHETIEYVPAKKRREHSVRHDTAIHGSNLRGRTSCRYLGNTWPSISCEGDQQKQYSRAKRAACQRCVDLPYGYILQNGLPTECLGCFQRPVAPPPVMWYGQPSFEAPSYTYDVAVNEQSEPDQNQEAEPTADSGWVLELQKCLGPDGQLEDCTPGKSNQDPVGVSDVAEAEKQWYEDEDIANEILSNYKFDGDDMSRRRRRI